MVLRYRRRSTASAGAVDLAAASGRGDDGGAFFFDGFVEHAPPAAQALLCVARVARSSFYDLSAMIAARDPVVTAGAGRLQFESFSTCCGVHARFDLLPEGLDVRDARAGTTNVDFNQPMRDALARIIGREPLRIRVGADSVEVQTLDESVVERRVPLPERWVKGFGEVQVALTTATPVLELDRAGTQRFVNSLPTAGRAGVMNVWVEQSGGSVRLVPTRRTGAVWLASPARLAMLRPLARLATRMTAYAAADADGPTAVGWVLDLPGSRFCLTLSPDRSRGFSGEGGLLLDLVSGQAAEDAQILGGAATGERLTLVEAASLLAATEARARAAMTWLGVHGHVGYDPVDRTFFMRHLPYPDKLLAADPPRLRGARKLADAGRVTLAADGSASVISEGREYRSTIGAGDYACTCPWIAKHGSSRGPCKHVLAAAIQAIRDGAQWARRPAPRRDDDEPLTRNHR
jgi:hypothetical protein